MKPKICKQCGKSYTSSGYYYCSDECKRTAKLNQTTKSNRKIRNIKPQMKDLPAFRPSRIEEIETKARAEGMSYGQYQAQKLMEYARVEI